MFHKNLRSISLFIAVCFLFSIIAPFSMPGAAAAAQDSQLTGEELAGKAVDFINQEFNAGKEISPYTAYVLALAGEDLDSGKWTRDGKTLKSEIKSLAEKLDDNNSIIDYIINTQNSDGSFGPLANEYGTKAPLQALALAQEDPAVGEDVYNAVDKAVEYFKNGYENGAMTYNATGFYFDYRCVESLTDAGVTVDDWVYDSKSLKEEVIDSVEDMVYREDVEDSVGENVYAPELAKQLKVLEAVSPGSGNIDDLAGAIKERQNDDGSFGSDIYSHVTALIALGETGELSSINKEKALDYINEYKIENENITGAAWGKDGIKESSLTAQVVTALSYLKDTGTDVESIIEDGLAYLHSIQDHDTAAIQAQWDSTFSTAETVIALESLGNSYSDYANGDSKWTKDSKTKTIAQSLMALNEWGENEQLQGKLVDLLVNRHDREGSFEDSVYSDMYAYLALAKAGKIEKLNTENVKNYILSKQHEEEGSWGETFSGEYYPDFMSSAQAIRVLTYLPGAENDDEIQASIEKGLAYFKDNQNEDGGVYTQFGDPAVDNSEVVLTLHKLEKDPESENWTLTKDGKDFNPVTYLINETMNSDGSFGSYGNVLGAREVLQAYLLESDEVQRESSGGDSGITPVEEKEGIKIAVVGKNGDILYGPGSVEVNESGEYGRTVAGALEAAGLNFTKDGTLITGIAGQANSGMNGWMYKINGSTVMTSAFEKEVEDGDEIIWWYSTDMSSSGPSWEELASGEYLEKQEIGKISIDEADEKISEIKEEIDNGGLEPGETAERIDEVLNGVQEELASEDNNIEDVQKTAGYFLDTVDSVIEKSNGEAVDVLKSVVSTGVKTLFERSDSGDIKEEIKERISSQVDKIISGASRVAPENTGENTAGVSSEQLEKKIGDIKKLKQELPGILKDAELEDSDLTSRAQVTSLNIDVSGNQGENTEINVSDSVARELGNNGLNISVHLDGAYTLKLTGQERSGNRETAVKGVQAGMVNNKTVAILGASSGDSTNKSGAEGYLLSVSRLNAEKIGKIEKAAEDKSGNNLNLRPLGKAYKIAFKDASGNEEIEQLNKPVELEADCRGVVENPEVAGFYKFINGRFEFAGADWDKSEKTIIAGIDTGGTYTLLEYDREFSDLDGHWARSEVRSLSARQVIGGVAPSKFGPSLETTRAQCAALLCRALDVPVQGGVSQFSDVKAGAWYANDVAAAASAGIISGNSRGEFNPERPVTRAEFASITGRVLKDRAGYGEDNTGEVLDSFKDSDLVPGWARGDVAVAVKAGIINGRTQDTLVPGETITRAEMAVMLNRLLDKLGKK